VSAAALSGESLAAVAALPARSIATLVRMAIPFADGAHSAAGISPAAASLATEVLKTMFRSNLNALGAAVAALCLVTVGAGVLAHSAGPQQIPAEESGPRRMPRVDAPSAFLPAPVLIAAKAVSAEEGDQEKADDSMTPYPVKIDPQEIHEYPTLTLEQRGFRLTSGPVALAPIACERGLTGAILIGNGTFRYTPDKGKPIEGHFHAAMLRFNPADQSRLAPLETGTKVTDHGIAEMSRHLMKTIFGHCWHSGNDALIPPKGSITAVLYTREHGDLLISVDQKTEVVFSFTARKTLHEKTP
jgi:hypothetical protein